MGIGAGLLLAGGRSSRFGSDKALAVVDGATLLDRAVACLREVCDGPLVVASGDGRCRPGVGDRQVADLVTGAGPLSAIGAGLADLVDDAGHVAVLAVDHLAPSAALLRHLAGVAGSWKVSVCEVDGRLQPLQAVWSTALADEVAAAVALGARSVVRWLEGRPDAHVEGEDALRAAGLATAVVRDVDRPGDLPPTQGWAGS